MIVQENKREEDGREQGEEAVEDDDIIDGGTSSEQGSQCVLVGGGRVYCDGDRGSAGLYGNHSPQKEGVSVKYQQQVDCQGKSGGSSSMPTSPASGIRRRQQQSKASKCTIASLISLCIPDEGFRSRERDFQGHVCESLSMEAGHEYFSAAHGRSPTSSSDIDDVVSNGDIIGMSPDLVRRVAFDYEGSKALQGIILSHGKAPPRMTMGSWRIRASAPTEAAESQQGHDELVIDRMYEALSNDIVNLCLDMYGNYTVQCLLMEASPSVALQLGDVIVSNLLPLSLNFYGCRVVQCAMKYLSMEYRVSMCDAIEPFALHCLQSQNANHVIDALLRMPQRDRPEHVTRIHACLCHQALILSRHKYGVTVLKTALESDISADVSREATRCLLEALGELVFDEYGNYLVQNLIQRNMYGTCDAVHEFLLQSPLLTLACDKFGSNVFERSLLNSNPEQSDAVIIAFLRQCKDSGQSDEIVASIAMNRYGNYVVQRMLAVSSPRVRQMLSRHLAPHCTVLIGSKHGKHIAKKLFPQN